MKHETLERAARDFREFDLHPPPLRSGMVFRDALVDRIETSGARVVTVIAPAGYGKTTTLSQWASRTDSAIAWLTLDAADNEAATLLARVASALRHAGVDAPEMAGLVPGDDVGSGVGGSHPISPISGVPSRLTVVFDDAHVLRTRAGSGVVGDLVRRLEGRARVIISSRSDPRLPLAAIRARGDLLELTEADLAMNEGDVASLLVSRGRSPEPAAERLTTVSGGWPGAISLLLAADLAGRAPARAFDVGADHRYLAEFIGEEILPSLPKAVRDLLRLLSPLERMSGPLTEAVVGISDARALLPGLARSTHLVHAVDDLGGWYEMNPVLRCVLRRGLEESDPASASSVHAEAAVWYAANDMPLEAIGHAQRAGDVDAFADLLARLIKERYATGHASDVVRWLDWLQLKFPLDRNPGLAAIGALVYAQEGRALEAARWLDAADRRPVGADTAAVIWLVRAAAMRSGIGRMLEDVETALATAAPGSRWLPAILVTKGIALVLSGDAERAEPCFIAAVETGLENRSLASVVLALGERALLAMGRRDWDLATSLAGEAVAIVDDHGLDGYHTSALALVVAARCARRGNDIGTARSLLARASSVRTRLSAALPGDSVQILIEMAKAHLELSDVAGARTMMREAENIVAQCADLGVLPAELDALRASLAGVGPGAVGVSALTRAELRLLPLLATNLSFPEIGLQLFISRHTVKTQATSIYRKLGTSSRSEAVAKAYETGLLQR